jgi:toxin ParE1/3/4
MSRYRLHPAAAADLNAIYDYVAERSESGADHLIDLLTEKFDFLAGTPLAGEPRPELADNIRSFTAGRYVIFYRPVAQGVDIARIIHSARDIGAAFGEDQP